MSPSDTLRALLDERGVEYGSGFGGDTLWTGRDGIEWRWDKQENILAMYSHTITPEQAIAATVGANDASTLQAKVKAQSDYINKLRGEYKALEAQMERRCAEYRAAIHKLRAELDAATVAPATDLASRLRKVTGLRSFAELFGFSWEDESDWDWHDVACAMADAIDATVGDYAITFAPTLDRPPETMVGETVYDSEGNAIGWIVNAVDEPDEATMLKLHDRMNAALLDYESAMGIEGGNGANTVPFVIEMHQIIEDAAKVGVGTCEGSFHESSDLSSGRVPLYYCKGTNKSIFMEREARFCPLCGKRIEEADE